VQAKPINTEDGRTKRKRWDGRRGARRGITRKEQNGKVNE
jgi:hypothetical protein